MTSPSAPRSPTPSQALRTAIEYYVREVHTCLPGRIEKWDAATQKADVKPLVKRRVATESGDELLEDLPVIPDVPIVFPRSSQFFVSFPLEVGDLVMLFFAEASIDKWLSGQGDDTDPDDFRTHDLSDAVAVPGLYPFSRALREVSTTNLVIGEDQGGLQIHITPDGTMEVKVDGESDSAAALGDVLQTWWTNTVKVWLDTHIHPTGTGPSGPATVASPAFDATIVSDVLKVKGP